MLRGIPTAGVQDFELLEHPADVGFRAHGRTLAELFGKCAAALLSIILDASEAGEAAVWQLSVEGIDRESLLVNWLNEVLYYVDAKRIVFARMEVEVGSNDVYAVCHGEPFDIERHPTRVLVKAVTYHQLRIFESDAGWTAEVFVDV